MSSHSINKDLEPAGIGGWLILPALGLVISPIWICIQLVRGVIPAINPSVWKILTDPNSAYYSPLWVPTILFEAVSDVLLLAFGLWLAYHFFFRRSSSVPRLFIIWLASHVAIQLVDWLLTKNLPTAAEESPTSNFTDLARSFVNAAIWIPYFMSSIRVKNTFVNTPTG